MTRSIAAAVAGVLFVLAPQAANAQALGQALDDPAAARARAPRTPPPAPPEVLAEETLAPRADDGASPYLALSVVSFGVTAAALGTLIGAQVRINDIANDPRWIAARLRFPVAENICLVAADRAVLDFCSEADTLEVLTGVSIGLASVAAVVGIIFLVLEVTSDTDVRGSASATGGSLRLRHRF